MNKYKAAFPRNRDVFDKKRSVINKYIIQFSLIVDPCRSPLKVKAILRAGVDFYFCQRRLMETITC